MKQKEEEEEEEEEEEGGCVCFSDQLDFFSHHKKSLSKKKEELKARLMSKEERRFLCPSQVDNQNIFRSCILPRNVSSSFPVLLHRRDDGGNAYLQRTSDLLHPFNLGITKKH